MKEMNLEKYERRCPRLGGPVHFAYCETCGEDSSRCFKIIDCWWEQFDIIGYLKENVSKEEFDRIVRAKPKPKVASLIELIQKAKSNA